MEENTEPEQPEIKEPKKSNPFHHRIPGIPGFRPPGMEDGPFSNHFKGDFLSKVPFKPKFRPSQWGQHAVAVCIAHHMPEDEVRRYMDIRMKRTGNHYPSHPHAILIGRRQIYRDIHGLHNPHQVMAGAHMHHLRSKLIGGMRDLTSDDPLQELLLKTDVENASPEAQAKIVEKLGQFVHGDINETHALTEVEIAALDDELTEDVADMRAAAEKMSYEYLVKVFNDLNVEDATYLVDHRAMWDALLHAIYEIMYAGMEQEMTETLGEKVDTVLAAEVAALEPIETVVTGVTSPSGETELVIIENAEAAGDATSTEEVITDLTETGISPTSALAKKRKLWKQRLNKIAKSTGNAGDKLFGGIKKGTTQSLTAIRDNKGRIIMYVNRARAAVMTPENKEHAKVITNHLMKMTKRFINSAGPKVRQLSGEVLEEGIKTAKHYAPEARDAAIAAARKIIDEALAQLREHGADFAKKAASGTASGAGSLTKSVIKFAGVPIPSHATLVGARFADDDDGDGSSGAHFQTPASYVSGIPYLDGMRIEFVSHANGMERCSFDGHIFPPGDAEWTFPPTLEFTDVLAVLGQLKSRRDYCMMLMRRLHLFMVNAPMRNPELVEPVIEAITRIREMEMCDVAFGNVEARPEYIQWIADLSGTSYRMLPLRDVVKFCADLIHALTCVCEKCRFYFSTKFMWSPALPIDAARQIKNRLLAGSF